MDIKEPLTVGLGVETRDYKMDSAPRARGRWPQYDDSGGLRECGFCHERKPLSDFPLRQHRWPHRKCKVCLKAHMRAYSQTPTGIRRRKNYSHSETKKAAAKRYHAKNGRVLQNVRRRERHDRVILKYGGLCNCCGENIKAFLAIDHVNNDGGIERKTIAYPSLLLRLDKLPPQPQYQCLCHNCNMGKHINGGVCPHEQVIKLVVSNGRSR